MSPTIPSVRLVVALLVILTIIGLVPTQSSQAQNAQRCFTETNQCISGSIRHYWERNGGLAVFGFPITAQSAENVEGQMLQVQWFERDRLEIQANSQVTAGRLGVERLAQQGTPWQHGPGDAADAGCLAFGETGHRVCGAFATYWQRNGGLERFGFPITGMYEMEIEGMRLTVQYFERRRFELHNANTVLLGLLGREVRSGTTHPPSNPSPNPDSVNPSVNEDEVVRLTNQERMRHGLAPLRANPQLSAAARDHSHDMRTRDFFGHTNPDGQGADDRACRWGYPTYWGTVCLVSENIAFGYPTPATVVSGWMNSHGHRRNILDPNSREIGVGYASGGRHGYYWTMKLGAEPGMFPVFINDAAPFTTSRDVQITLTRETMIDWFPFVQPDAVYISEYPDFSQAVRVAWAPRVPFTLSPSLGIKVVYVKLVDGNEERISSATIELR